MILKIKKMKKNNLNIVITLLLFFSNYVLANNLSEDVISNLICKIYSYVNIQGKDLNINPDDYLLIKKDGSFHYQVDSLKKDGDWTLNGMTLTFNYKMEVIKLRIQRILKLNQFQKK